MAKITVKKTVNYTTIDNNIFKNKNLSLKARGILCTMLSLPDEWDYTVSGLCSILKDGKSSIQSALKELEENGYLVRTQTKDSQGRFAGTDYTLYEVPITEKPLTENRSTDNLSTGNPPQLNTNRLNTKKENTNVENNNKNASTKVEGGYNALFETNKDENTRTGEYIPCQIKEFINKKVDEIINELDPAQAEESQLVSEIISYFYQKYYEVMGEPHPIMSDFAYSSIIEKLLSPIDVIYDSEARLNVDAYKAMIDRFFKTEYGKRSGRQVDYRISYFFNDKILEHLFYRELY